MADMRVTFGAGMGRLIQGIDKIREATLQGRLSKSIGEGLVASMQLRFRKQIDPEGNKWQATKRGGQILRDTGRLRKSFGYEASPGMVVVGTNVEYAPTHQHGAEIKTRKGKALKKPIVIPARPFLGFSNEDKQMVNDIAQRIFDEYEGK